MPVWTSSRISNAFARSQAARAACKNCGAKSNAPASPCTGSMMTAAVLASTAASRAAASLRGTNTTSNGVRGKPYQDFAAPYVTAAAAAVLPWKLCSIATTLERPVTLNASRSAFSFASAPLLTKKTRPRPGGPNAASFSAASSRTESGSAFVWNTRSRLARAIVSQRSR
jgi:hypothetical protein